MEEKKKKRGRKKKHSRKVWIILLIVFIFLFALLATGVYLFINTTYDDVQIVTSYQNERASDGNYVEYAGGFLRYNRDGIKLLDEEGKELWNHPCQMSNPTVKVCKDTAVVFDVGGTNICVFQKDGLKGEMQTTRPIEKTAVSAQGIVAVILQDETYPQVMCYDAKGTVLVKHEPSFEKTGYPVAIDLSQDGKVLVVSYIYTEGNGIASRVAFYHFGKTTEKTEGHCVAEKEYEDVVIPTVEFLDKDTVLMVSDQSLIIYEGLEKPEEKLVVKIDKEIQSIAYDEKHIALMLKNSGKTEYELCMYNMNGKRLMSASVEGEYTNMKVSDGQVLLYDEGQCAIYNSAGVCKFEGALEMHILNLFTISGLNKYMVISANGFQEIQLVKLGE